MTALALLVHLVGDVHQPLHVGRGPDRGGNSIDVYWFGEPVVLHEVWDEGLIEKEALSFTEFAVFLVQDLGVRCPRKLCAGLMGRGIRKFARQGL